MSATAERAGCAVTPEWASHVIVLALTASKGTCMLTLSLATILEEAASDKNKHLEGNVKDIQELLKPENLAALQEVAKVFAFLAFHPVADTAVADYVRSGTLADDSGPDVLALFTLDEPAPTPVAVDDRSFSSWLHLGKGVHPAYQMVRTLFEGTYVPPLPGVLFFHHDWASHAGAVYVPLNTATEQHEVRVLLRKVFALAAHEANPTDAKGALDRLCVALLKERIEYDKTRGTSMQEWLITSFRLVAEHSGDIVSVVGLAL